MQSLPNETNTRTNTKTRTTPNLSTDLRFKVEDLLSVV